MSKSWIPRFVAVLLVAALVSIVGIVVSALAAPQPGVFDDWGRIDDIGSRVASWEYVLVALAGGLMVAFGHDRARVRRVLWLTLIYLAVLAVAALVGVIAVLERQTLQLDGLRPTIPYYTPNEQLGEIVVFAGLLVAIAGIGIAVAVELRRDTAQKPAA